MNLFATAIAQCTTDVLQHPSVDSNPKEPLPMNEFSVLVRQMSLNPTKSKKVKEYDISNRGRKLNVGIFEEAMKDKGWMTAELLIECIQCNKTSCNTFLKNILLPAKIVEMRNIGNKHRKKYEWLWKGIPEDA